MNKVTFVRQGPFLLVQFNTTCDDALKVCNAMCCRMRPYFNITVNDDEAHKYATVISQGSRILDAKPNGDCVYLQGNRCSIHEDKPQNCRNWHCSPYGNIEDKGITKRANGWLLVVGSDEVLGKLVNE